MTAAEYVLWFGRFLLVFIPLAFIPVMIFVERKGASFMQDRIGPNRASLPVFGGLRLFGFIHNFTDGIKLFTKESFVPAHAHKFWYVVAPGIPFLVAMTTPVVLPWFAPFAFWTGDSLVRIPGQILEADAGILLLFAINSLGVYGTVMGAWASNSKYALLGGMRASAMMVSYEVSMGLSLMGIFLLVGSFSLQEIVAWQETHLWGIVVQPVAFFVFLISMVAETGRAPFDVAEGESELVAGYHVEYSGIRFGLYYMAEYAHIVIAGLVIATLFLGGYSIPWVSTEAIHANLGIVLGVLLFVFALMLAGLFAMIQRWKGVYRNSIATDKVNRLKEYNLIGGLVALGVAVTALGAIASFVFLKTTPSTIVDGVAVWPVWVAAVTAAVQLLVLVAKAFFFCWVWVWLRWTLPRFRYDHVMHLGWKILLNVALVNLLVTAVVAKLVTGVR